MKDHLVTVHVNRVGYEALLKKVGYVPENMVLNPYIPDNQAIVFNGGQYKLRSVVYEPRRNPSAE